MGLMLVYGVMNGQLMMASVSAFATDLRIRTVGVRVRKVGVSWKGGWFCFVLFGSNI